MEEVEAIVEIFRGFGWRVSPGLGFTDDYGSLYGFKHRSDARHSLHILFSADGKLTIGNRPYPNIPKDQANMNLLYDEHLSDPNCLEKLVLLLESLNAAEEELRSNNL